jgi:hypothetical protein
MYEDIIKTAAAKGHGLGSEQLEPIIATAISLALAQSTAPPPVTQIQPIPKDPELVRQLDAANKEIASLRHQVEIQSDLRAKASPPPPVKPAIASAKPKAHKPKHRY